MRLQGYNLKSRTFLIFTMPAPKDKIVAVITADIVDSTSINPELLDRELKILATDIEQFLFKGKRTFEFFRGDSIQALMSPKLALKTALIWRAGIRAWMPGLDLRIAIGIGKVDHKAKSLSLSNGSAFTRSGLLLDTLKTVIEYRIAFATGDEQLDETLLTQSTLAEQIMNRWTVSGSEVMYYQLLHNETQEQLAERLGISQPSVHKRLASAGGQAIQRWEMYFSKTCTEY